jgi:death-on-curing protein
LAASCYIQLWLTRQRRTYINLYHLSKNHPFVDGNKRTAFAVMDTFIRLNGARLGLTSEQAYELTMQVAQGQLNKDAVAQRLAAAIAQNP